MRSASTSCPLIAISGHKGTGAAITAFQYPRPEGQFDGFENNAETRRDRGRMAMGAWPIAVLRDYGLVASGEFVFACPIGL